MIFSLAIFSWLYKSLFANYLCTTVFFTGWFFALVLLRKLICLYFRKVPFLIPVVLAKPSSSSCCGLLDTEEEKLDGRSVLKNRTYIQNESVSTTGRSVHPKTVRFDCWEEIFISEIVKITILGSTRPQTFFWGGRERSCWTNISKGP